MKKLYNLFLTFNSTSWIILLYGIKEKWTICSMPSWKFSCLILLIPIITSWISLKIASKFSDENLNGSKDVDLADNTFLSIYLGYFFVGLALNNITELIIVYSLVFIFTFVSQAQYFNPVFLLFGYKFYYVKTISETKIFLITRQSIRNAKEIYNSGHEKNKSTKLKRLNETTFIQFGRK